jgi:hypothetical protein
VPSSSAIGFGKNKGDAEMNADMRTKVLIAVLGLVVLVAAVWFGKDLLPAGETPPAPAPASTPQQAGAATLSDQDRDALIGQALEATGMNRAVDQISQQMTEGGDASGAAEKLPPEVLARIRQAMLESFPAEPMRERLRQRLRADFNEPYLRALLADVGKPAVQKLIALESNPAPSRETLTAFAEEQRQAPPPPARAELFKRLEAAVGATRQASEIVLVTARAMMQGAASTGGGQVPDLEGKLGQLRANLEPTLRDNLLLSMAYTYRQASDEELTAYTALYESPHGRWFTDNIFLALRDGFQADSERFGARIAERAQQMRAPSATKSTTQAAAGQGEAAPEAEAPAAAPVARPHRRWHQDARECLKHERDRDVIRCAERYY